MSFYIVADLKSVIFVPSQDVVDANSHLNCRVGTLEDAKQLLAEIQAKCLADNTELFHVVKEIEVGQDVTWVTVTDINTCDHDGVFQLFDTTRGIYVKAEGKQAALTKLEELKNNFLAFRFIAGIEVVEELPQPPKEDPIVSSGEIPIGVM